MIAGALPPGLPVAPLDRPSKHLRLDCPLNPRKPCLQGVRRLHQRFTLLGKDKRRLPVG